MSEERHLYVIFETMLFNSIISRHQNDDFYLLSAKIFKNRIDEDEKKVLN